MQGLRVARRQAAWVFGTDPTVRKFDIAAGNVLPHRHLVTAHSCTAVAVQDPDAELQGTGRGRAGAPGHLTRRNSSTLRQVPVIIIAGPPAHMRAPDSADLASTANSPTRSDMTPDLPSSITRIFQPRQIYRHQVGIKLLDGCSSGDRAPSARPTFASRRRRSGLDRHPGLAQAR